MREIKAITVYQPWASLVAIGAKTILMRRDSTPHRGELLIHAGCTMYSTHRIRADRARVDLGMLAGRGIWRGPMLPDELPLGAIVATCKIFNCKRVDDALRRDLAAHMPVNAALLEPIPEDFAWILSFIEPFEPPIPCRGRRGGRWTPDADLVRRVDATRPVGGRRVPADQRVADRLAAIHGRGT